MKKILITGKDSYVGNSFEMWLKNYPCQYEIDKVSLRNKNWKKVSFSKYDVVLHVAAIAHRKETEEDKDLYYKVNRDLAYEVAIKAKKEGVSHFIFLSSMSVYGIEKGVIDSNSLLKPKSNYGKSKLQAEGLITSLDDDLFKVTILRPPMVYGKNCKGNYSRLAKFALKTPFFPKIENKRSMIFINNLSEFVRLVISNGKRGIYHPQNFEYICTSEMVKKIAEIHGTNIRLTSFFNFFIRIIKINTVNKVFADLIYDKQIDRDELKGYTIYDFETSMKLTEK